MIRPVAGSLIVEVIHDPMTLAREAFVERNKEIREIAEASGIELPAFGSVGIDTGVAAPFMQPSDTADRLLRLNQELGAARIVALPKAETQHVDDDEGPAFDFEDKMPAAMLQAIKMVRQGLHVGDVVLLQGAVMDRRIPHQFAEGKELRLINAADIMAVVPFHQEDEEWLKSISSTA